MHRVFNFAAGPATLPTEVLAQAASEMLDWQGSGVSVMEMSHRGPEFMHIHQQALADLRTLLALPDDYEILFMQGGGRGQNAIVPMNLISRLDPDRPRADYVVTGTWSEQSFVEAKKYGDVHLAASTQTDGFTTVPAVTEWSLSDDAAYLHVCTNETIHGVEFHSLPALDKRVVVVADMSSHLLSRPIDSARYGVIYAGAQKNIGSAGLTIVIVRRDLLGHALPCTPSVFNWELVSKHQSMLNTPPTYAIYIAGLVFQWLMRAGGLVALEQRNRAKAALLYRTIDDSHFYTNPVEVGARSYMNVPFFLADASRNAAFLDGAKARGLTQLKGHSLLGGMRASIYNAMPIEGVQALVDYMVEFERHHA
ncbi:MAG: 3-phosphoserine/phosphohydroxythreonine transaminase [Ottowia sp.]|nr:3-phosphoserine/phosphohydroxythreonine transaminase [Ottowia sp.]